MVLNACAQRNQNCLICRFFFDLDAQNNSSSISEAASLIKGRRLRATASTSYMLDSSPWPELLRQAPWGPCSFHAGYDKPHTHMLDSSVHGAPVSFMHDGTQDRLNVSVQLASSSDAERIFSVMNDISHGRSGGMCLRFRPPCALHLPCSAALLVCYSTVH